MKSIGLACLAVASLVGGVFGQEQTRGFTLDSFQVYDIRAVAVNQTVVGSSAFDDEPRAATLSQLAGISVPIAVGGMKLREPLHRLNWYRLSRPTVEPIRLVEVRNRFGLQRLALGRARFLIVPGSPGEADDPLSARDFFKVYEVYDGPGGGYGITIARPNSGQATTVVSRPRFVAMPAAIEIDGQQTGIIDPKEALVFYQTTRKSSRTVTTTVTDTFAHRRLSVGQPLLLGAPSNVALIEPIEGLDYFTAYNVPDIPLAAPQFVRLQGVFDPFSVHATVRRLTHFAAPASVSRSPIVHPAARFTWYAIDHYSPDPIRQVTIWNRFGVQVLTLGRSTHLLTPARLGDGVEGSASLRQDGTVPVALQANTTLDHFKAYVVLRASFHGSSVPNSGPTEPCAAIGKPAFFCVPTTKKRGDDPAEAIEALDQYLTFYRTSGQPGSDEVGIEDQFGANSLSPGAGVMLGVPSHRFEAYPRIRPQHPQRDLAIPNPDDMEGIKRWFESLLEHAQEQGERAQ